MARNKGGFVFASNFEVKLKEALDPRVVVDVKADLINKETWPYDGDTIYLYKGLVVAVAETGSLYMLVDPANATASDYSAWKQLDAEAAESIDVIDNLTSDRTDAALSAAQGKALMSEITTIAGKLQGIYSYKGSVETFNALPTEGLVVGDVYNVVTAVENHPAGTNFAWTGTTWDALGGSLDLSAYFNKEEVAAAIKVETDRAVAEEARIEGLVTANATEIGNVKADVAKNLASIETLSTGLSEANAEIANKVDAVEGSSLISAEKLALIDTNAANITLLETADTNLGNRVTALENLFSDSEGGEIDLGTINNQIAVLEQDNVTNKSDISGLKTSVSDIVSINTQQATDISNLGTKITTVEGNVTTNTTSIGNLVTLAGSHTSQINDLTSRVNNLTVKSIKEGEKVLSADASGALSSTIGIKYVAATEEDTAKLQITGVGNQVVAEMDATAFVKDGMISSVDYSKTDKQLTITWNTDAGKDATILDVSDLVDTYTADEKSIVLSDHTFSVKLDENTNNKLTVSDNGLLVDISGDIEALENSIDSKIETAFKWHEVV